MIKQYVAELFSLRYLQHFSLKIPDQFDYWLQLTDVAMSCLILGLFFVSVIRCYSVFNSICC